MCIHVHVIQHRSRYEGVPWSICWRRAALRLRWRMSWITHSSELAPSPPWESTLFTDVTLINKHAYYSVHLHNFVHYFVHMQLHTCTWKYKCIAHHIVKIVVENEKKGIQTQQTTPKKQSNTKWIGQSCAQPWELGQWVKLHVHI